MNVSSLESVNFPNVVSIGDKFLYFDGSLTSIELPNVRSVGKYFCNQSMSIQTVNIPLIPELEEKLKEQGKQL